MSDRTVDHMVEYLWSKAETARGMKELPYNETHLVGALALKSNLRPEYVDKDFDVSEAIKEDLPTITPCSYRRISRVAPWLGESVLSFLKNLSDEKFAYLDGVIEKAPEEIRGCLRDRIYQILDATYEYHPIAAHRVLGVRHSKRLGTVVILDNGDDYSETEFKYMLRNVFGEDSGFTVRAPMGWRGVGVQVIDGAGCKCFGLFHGVRLDEVKARSIWQLEVGMDSMLPLMMGFGEFDAPFIVNLAELSLCVVVAADLAALENFVNTVVLDLVKVRKSRDIKFLAVDGSMGVMSWLYRSELVPDDYIVGEEGEALYVDSANDAAKIKRWCAHAKRQLDRFRNELEVRRRLFKEFGVDCVSSYEIYSKRSLAHWVLCLANLPVEAVKYESPAYEVYNDVVSEAHELMFSDESAKYGMHIIYFTFSRIDEETQRQLHWMMYGGKGIGIAVTYGQFTPADSVALIGCDDATRVCNGHCIYRSPLGEITDYCPAVG